MTVPDNDVQTCVNGVVTNVSNMIVIAISLVRVVIIWTVVTLVSNTILVPILLARVWCPDTVVLATGLLLAVQGHIGPAIIVLVWTTMGARANPACIALALLAAGRFFRFDNLGLVVAFYIWTWRV